MLAEVAAWWAQQMRSLLPRGLQGGTDILADALLIAPDVRSGGFGLAVRRRRRRVELGHCDSAQAARVMLTRERRRLPAVLELPADLLLERRVPFPLAVERDLDQVVGYEMDRITPFGPGEVFWRAAVQGRDRTHGKLDVLLSLVPRVQAAQALEAVAGLGLAPAWLEVDQAASPVRRIDLGHAPSPAARRRRLAATALGVVCAVLAVAVVATPFATQELALAALDARIEALRPRVAEAEALRARIADRASGADTLTAEWARLGDPLQAIAALTDILPDDTHLTELRLRQRRLSMAGQSAGAARLIAALAADPAIRNPAFAAPVTRLETGKMDLFSIRAELGP